MRRFITSLTGKVFSQVVIFALLLPSITLALLSRSEAQVAVLPRWAVVEFTNKKSPGTPLGMTAAKAVSSELAKTGQYDLQADDTVNRQIEQLKIATPPEGANNLVRLGEALVVDTLVAGNIVDYRVLTSSTGSKQAIVQLSVSVYDMASGLPVNGAIVKGESTVRPSDAKDEELLEDAIQQGASQAIREIQSHQLPTGTVLNTVNNSALVNKGSRSGFNLGQEVIVIRGRNQVATARVSDVEPDSSTIRIERGYVGIQPGDKVRAIWTIPSVVNSTIDAKGGVHTVHPKRSGSNSGVITVLLVLGIVAALLSGGNSNSQSATADVTAQAQLYPDISGNPAVQISWSPNGFAKGNSNRAQWQVWRDDVLDGPVLVVPGGMTKVVDTNVDRTGDINYLDTQNKVGGTTCDYGDVTNETKTGALGVKAGRPYQYSVELVYVLNSLELPGTSAGSGSSSGTNSGTNTGSNSGSSSGSNSGSSSGSNSGSSSGSNSGSSSGSNSGSSSGTSSGSTDGGENCYFLSARSPASGLATPLLAPSPSEPSNNSQIDRLTNFKFSSVATGGFNIAVEYVVQLSTTSAFTKGTTITVASTVRTGTTDVTIPLDTTNGEGITSAIRNATTLYYRIGARNVADKPGPLKDPTTGVRYIFSQWRVVTRTGTPPPPPAY